MAQADIALIGLAVMGQNLILNMNDHGFVVCAFNRTVSKVDDFLAKEAKGTKVIGAKSLKDMVSKLKKPRRVILLVKAGQAVDDFIEKLVRPAPFSDAADNSELVSVPPSPCLTSAMLIFTFWVQSDPL
ncbi:rCG31394, isoform CRA_c [Rattus norvegicus]|uniref:RCG31394, isoform CRA_c n=1 Tax=Rattus norvegicus TaxID=10116 RepID=A6IUA4_RAT|nr:rCG31394, isoform CRA_c [Rattus norvegicus]